MSKLACFSVSIFFTQIKWGIRAEVQESQLISDLLHGYFPYERPTIVASKPVVVKLGYQLIEITDLDEKSQIMHAVGYLRYVWQDYNLRWNPKEYADIASISLPIELIWKPDVLLYNSADEKFDTTHQTKAEIFYNGTVLWRPPTVTKSSCKIDVTYFPFDDQICYFKFGSWSYNGLKVELRIDNVGLDTTLYTTNGEWLLMNSGSPYPSLLSSCNPIDCSIAQIQNARTFKDTSVDRTTNYYAYSVVLEPFYDIKFYLHLRRMTLFFGLNVILPSLMVSMMALVTFYMPPDACEKIALETTVLMALVYCLQVIADMTPVTSEAIPLISLFYLSCILLMCVSSGFAVLVIAFHNAEPHSQKEISLSVLSFLNGRLTKYLLIQRPAAKETNRAKKRTFISLPGRLKRISKLINYGSTEEDQAEIKCAGEGVPECSVHLNKSVLAEAAILLHNMETDVNKLANAAENIRTDATFTMNWKYTALVVDRICLILFTAAFLTFCYSILFSAKYIIA